MRGMLQKTGKFFKDGFSNLGGKIKKGGKAVGTTIKSNSGTIKDAGKAVGGAVLGKGTVENLGELTGENKKKGVKGLAKAGLVIGVMVAVGVLAGPLVGPLAAAVFAIGAGVATPKIASSLGSKGMENTAKERENNRLDQLKPKKLQERKKELEKSASQKKKIGIAAISIGVIATILTGGTALPLLLGAFAIGGIALKSSGTDSKKAAALEGISDKSSKEDLQNAAKAAGVIKEKDVEKMNEMNGQSQAQNSQVINNQAAEIELADLSSKGQGQNPEKDGDDIFLDKGNKFDQENGKNDNIKSPNEIELADLSSKGQGQNLEKHEDDIFHDASNGSEKNESVINGINQSEINEIAKGMQRSVGQKDLKESEALQDQSKGREIQ